MNDELKNLRHFLHEEKGLSYTKLAARIPSKHNRDVPLTKQGLYQNLYGIRGSRFDRVQIDVLLKIIGMEYREFCKRYPEIVAGL